MSKFIENATIRDSVSGFYLNGDFNGLRYLVGNTTGETIEMYQEEEPQNSIKLNLDSIVLEDIDGTVVTPATIEGKAALLSNYVSKAITNSRLVTSDGPIDFSNPLSAADIDPMGRFGLNTVFGDRIYGIRKTSIAAQFQYGIEDGTSEAEIVSTGSVSIVESMLVISSGVAVDGKARIQSTETIRYVPGQETYCNLTVVFSSPKADSKQFAGLYDDDDGFFFGYNTDGLFYFTRRREGVDEFHVIDIAAFNTKYRYTFDPMYGNVYRISFGYLGFAPISLEVMLPTGSWGLLHKIEYPNSATETHIQQTFLPVRGEVENSGNDTDVVIKSGSLAAGIVDGGGDDIAGRRFSWANEVVFTVLANTTLVTFRNKTSFQGRTNRVPALLLLIAGDLDTNKSGRWKLYKNPTLEAAPVPVWADADTNNSTLEYSLNADVDYAASTELYLAWNVFKTSDFFEIVEDLELLLSPGETASFVIEGTGIGEANLSIRWSELF